MGAVVVLAVVLVASGAAAQVVAAHPEAGKNTGKEGIG